MTKICFITTMPGTIDLFVQPFGQEFVKRGYDVTYICSSFDEGFRARHSYATCISVPMNRGFDVNGFLFAPARFKRIFKKDHFDAVFFGTPNASYYASKGAKKAHLQKRFYLQWGYRYVGFTDPLRRSLAKIIEKATFKNSVYSVIVSQKNRQLAIEEGFCTPQNSGVAGVGGVGGVDTEYTEKILSENNKNALKIRYGISQNGFVYGFVGRMNTDKGINELIDAFNLLKSKRPDRKIFLVLQGPNDIASKQTLSKLREAKKNPNIVLIGGLPHSESLHVMSTFDCLVHPTYRDGFGTTIEEAMAFGIPCITTNIPGPSEVLDNGVNGLLVKVRDTEALACAMEVYLMQPELVKKFGDNAKTYALEHYDMKKCVKEYVDFLENLIVQNQ